MWLDQVRKKSTLFKSKHILIPIGGDLEYQKRDMAEAQVMLMLSGCFLLLLAFMLVERLLVLSTGACACSTAAACAFSTAACACSTAADLGTWPRRSSPTTRR